MGNAADQVCESSTCSLPSSEEARFLPAPISRGCRRPRPSWRGRTTKQVTTDTRRSSSGNPKAAVDAPCRRPQSPTARSRISTSGPHSETSSCNSRAGCRSKIPRRSSTSSKRRHHPAKEMCTLYFDNRLWLWPNRRKTCVSRSASMTGALQRRRRDQPAAVAHRQLRRPSIPGLVVSQMSAASRVQGREVEHHVRAHGARAVSAHTAHRAHAGLHHLRHLAPHVDHVARLGPHRCC